MSRLCFLIFFCALSARAAIDQISLDARILARIPAERKAALQRFAISGRDSSPAIAHKKADYIATLRSMVHRLIAAYYMHSEFPEGIDAAIEKRAIFESGLRYPGSASTGASFYGDLIQRYQIRMYEDDVVSIALALCERFKDRDVAVVGAPAPTFSAWIKEWDESGRVEKGPNQSPEPTAMSVTPPAAQEPRQP
jgi:hypothetical protein